MVQFAHIVKSLGDIIIEFELLTLLEILLLQVSSSEGISFHTQLPICSELLNHRQLTKLLHSLSLMLLAIYGNDIAGVISLDLLAGVFMIFVSLPKEMFFANACVDMELMIP